MLLAGVMNFDTRLISKMHSMILYHLFQTYLQSIVFALALASSAPKAFRGGHAHNDQPCTQSQILIEFATHSDLE